MESTEINAIELSVAIDTMHPLTRVSFCSAGSIKASTGIEWTAHDATYFPSLPTVWFSVCHPPIWQNDHQLFLHEVPYFDSSILTARE